MVSALPQVNWSPPVLDSALQRVLTRIRLRARRRAAWLQRLWKEEGIHSGTLALSPAEIETYLDDRDAPDLEAQWLATEATVQVWNQQIAAVEAAIAQDSTSRLTQLTQIFGLTQADLDLFQICLAAALDPSLKRVYAYLQDNASRSYVTTELAARLFNWGRCCNLSAESPLLRWHLIHATELSPGEPQLLECDLQIRDWLLGYNDLHPSLVGVATIQPTRSPLAAWPLAETIDCLKQRLNNSDQAPIQVNLVGASGSGRRTFAAAVCRELGLLLLTLETDAIDAADWQTTFVYAQRQAYLDRCALAWIGRTLESRLWPHFVPGFPVQFVIAEPVQSLPAIPESIEYRIELPNLTLSERRHLWQQAIPAAVDWPAGQFESLLVQHQVSVGEIAAVARRSVSQLEEVTALIRESSRHRLGSLAQLLGCPFTWQDLVVPEALQAALKDLVFEAQERIAFWEQPTAQRLFPQGRSLVALFSGAPGTGKTMAAQVIAAELGLDLFRIDLSAVVSKYVGETAQNLEQILSRAAQMDVVLLFDEADALFGKRTEIKDAHDRFANTDTNHLLQAIETYPGVALLATNKKSNIDTAFIRRLRYVLEFSKPDAAQRQQIWQRLIGELAGAERLSVLEDALESLSSGLEMTGAQIKLAVLSALFAARRDRTSLSLIHLIKGIERELMKAGRSLSQRDRERLLLLNTAQ